MRDPINPADIRVGDRVERVQVWSDDEAIRRFRVQKVAGNTIFGPDEVRWNIRCDETAEWFLLDRPDPLAEVVEVAAKAIFADDRPAGRWADLGSGDNGYRRNARAVLAAISERWELVERGKP